MSQSLIVLDGGYNITAWNPADEKMWGIKQNDAIGKNIFSLDMGTRIQGLRQKIEQAIESRTTYRRAALEYTAPSGEKRLMELTIVPLINTDGKSMGAMLLSQDITESRK